MQASRFLHGLVAGTAFLIVTEAFGQADVPAVLEPWRDWVLHGEAYRACPVLDGAMPGERAAHVCAWPGELALEVTSAGASFSQRWQVGDADWLPLPGNAELWPAEVRLDGQAVAVVERDGRPALRAAAGGHTVTGRLSWSQRPASIAIPPQAGLVGLTLDGARVARPEIERGTLWLGRAPEAAVEEDSLTVDVYRLLSDGLPVRATTEIQLDVAGQGREVALTGMLLPGFVGERLDSPLPAQLDADGVLRVQLRPGYWTLRLTAHAAGLPTAIALPEATAPWPAEEVWSYAAATRLRVAVIEGPPPIDGRAADVPADWAGYPSYRVVAGSAVDLLERSRNDADAPNRLSLERTLWLDFAGGGFTALDAITGQMSSGWRLDMAAPYVMTMATSDLANPGGESDYLITTPGTAGVQGVEIRAGALDLETIARLGSRGAVPVTGYLDDFDSVRTVLHLPPGHRLLAAPGADAVFGAWLNDWRLLDVFLALIVATATWRLLGVGPGLLAAATMVLVLHEPAAPRWIWLNVLVALGLLKVAPLGRLRRAASLYHYASLAVLVLLLIPFTVTQLRTVVFPQLERAMLGRGGAVAQLDYLASGIAADVASEERMLRGM
ncbi:MAG TPA: hypothetical protein VLD39_05430, partial [Gammaproteobacteria bacterium]|nr:hypothetical protein [Gammaproteobacteria bacterium]